MFFICTSEKYYKIYIIKKTFHKIAPKILKYSFFLEFLTKMLGRSGNTIQGIFLQEF